jgi:hypothetical protein
LQHQNNPEVDELAISVAAAKALGREAPPTRPARADETFE